MFASTTQSEVKIGDVIVKIRKLSYSQLSRASEVRQMAAAKLATALGADMMKTLQSAGSAQKTEEKPVDPKLAAYSTYDVNTVIRSGIVSWSVDVKLDAGIDDLDEESAEKIFRAIIDLSVSKNTADDSPKV